MKYSFTLFSILLLLGISPQASAQLGGPNGSGQWSGVIQTPIVPVAAANLPNGKVLTWSAYGRFAFGGNQGKTYTAIFDPATNSSQELLVSNTQHDMFCPGTSVLPDGRIMVTGGSSSNKTSIYDPSLNQWTSGASTQKARGYHSMVTMANGDVFTIGGSWSGGTGNKHGEIYENGSWRLLSGVPVNVILDGATDPAGVVKNDNFPWLWTAPNGKIFHAGPSSNMHWIDPTGNGSYTNAGARSDDVYAYAGTTVMYDEGKILKTGGASSYGDGRAASSSTYIIDINTNQAQVEKVQNLSYSRNKHNTVVLPTGEVLAIGGLGVAREFSDQASRLVPEIFNPVSKTWRSLAAMQTPRNYHSIALLLPDGRVMAGGGGLCGTCTVNHADVEIFSPPYLFNSNGTLASRPSITSTNAQFGNNSQETVRTNSAVSYFSLVRYNVATHSTNNDQRRIPVTTTSLGNNNYRINIPNENILPPGPYMLFAVNANGTPSVAQVVEVSPAPPPPPVNPGGSGLTGNYFNNKNFTSAAFNRVDPVINFNWGTGSPASNMGADTYSVRWEGVVAAPYTGTYTFYTQTDDGVRLWVNGQLLIDKWIPQGTTEWSGSITLQAGQQTSIKMEYYEEGGAAVAKLLWSGPYTSKQIIPANYFFPQGSPQAPQASFTATPTSGIAPLPVSFNASASSDPDGTIASYQWNFGDGTNATGVSPTHTYAQAGSYTAQVIVADQAGNKDSAVQVIVVNAASPCDQLNLPNYTFKTYASGQDVGTAQIQNTDQSVLLTGNAWKYIDFPYTITPNTVLSLEFKSTVQPELGGIGLDNDNGINNEQIFHLYGFQNTTSLGVIQDFNTYTPGGYTQYEIPIGQYYTGAMDRIFFVADHDASPMNGNAFFKNVRVYERGTCPAQTPIASFTATPSNGTAPLLVNFDANGSSDPFGSISSYAWDFGDGTNGAGLTASHTYTQAGTFVAKLVVTDQGGNKDSTTKNIVVDPENQAPIANITGTPTSGDAPLPVSFDGTGSSDDKGITAYNWDFGDGNNGTGASVSHTYTAAGTYTASLSVSDVEGLTDTKTLTITVSTAPPVNTAPIASFTTTPSNGEAPLPVSVDGSGSSDDKGVTAYTWDFGDGSSGTGATATHTYVAAGSYTISLTVADVEGLTDTKTSIITVTNPVITPPIDGDCFLVNNINEVWIEAEHFSGQAAGTGNASGSTWSKFSDNTASNDSAVVAGPNAGVFTGLATNGPRLDYHIYFDTPGNYSVFVRALGANGADDSFHAGLNGNPLTTTTGYGMSVPPSWTWAEEANEGLDVVLNIPSAGSYTFNLWMREDGIQIDKIFLIPVGGNGPYQEGEVESDIGDCGGAPANTAPVASLSTSLTSGEAPLPVNFDGSSSTDDKGVVSYTWNFGDGATATGSTASHTYAIVGNYTASLTVADQEGLTDTKNINITITEPGAGDCFIADANGRVWIEAENFSSSAPGTGNASGSSWLNYTDGTASAGGAVRAEPNDGVFTGLTANGPRLDYDIYFATPGSYAVYVRGKGPSGSDDSFHAGLNGNPLTITAGYGMSVPPTWTWAEEANDGIDVILNIPSAGKYTFNLWMREDGVSVDKIFMIPQGGNGPAGTGETESSRGDCGGSQSNQAPVASFTTTPSSGPAPLAVNFDANGSTDDNGIVSYSWDFGDGSTGTGVGTSHSYASVGQFTATLTVADAAGLTNSSSTIILVQNPGSQDCFAEVNGEVVIEAENFSNLSPGTGNATASTWSVITDANASGSKAMEAGPNTGVYTGLNINGPRLDYNIDFSETGVYRIYILTSAPGPNDDSYHVGLDGNSVSTTSGYGMGLNGPWAWADYANDDDFVEVNVASVGKHTFNVWMREDGVQIDKIILSKANYPFGQGPAESGQSPCSGVANQAPIASFSATPSSGFAPLAVSIDASASTDSDGTIASYSWSFGDGTNGSGQTLSHTYTNVGNYTLTLTVTDNEGLTNQSSRTITVSPQGTGPLCHQETAGLVVMEAENYSSTSSGTGNASGSSWQKINNSSISNGEGVKAMPNANVYTGLNTNGPRLDYDITFSTAGTYRVYIRANGPSGTDDSFHAGLNGQSVTSASGYGMGYTGNWFWASEANEDPFVEVVVPNTGQHTFNVWMREDGVELDKIVLKIQPGSPSGQGPTESTLAECASQQSFNNESFSVSEDGGNADLNWGNFFEEFKDNYVLERSVDGLTFEQLEAEEISVDKLINEHTDPNIHQYEVNQIFYRLRIKDSYGRTRKERSGILNLRTSFENFAVNVYPNPASEKLNIEFDNTSGKALNLKVMSALGQTVHRATLDGQETHGIVKLDVGAYAEGIYFVQLTDGETSQVIRVLVD